MKPVHWVAWQLGVEAGPALAMGLALGGVLVALAVGWLLPAE